MKKVLSTVAALGLVVGIASSAAALELKIKGDYTVDGFYISDGNGAAATDGGGGGGVALIDTNTNESDAWLQHMFNIEAEMVVNDKISMMSRVRLIDWGTVWGQNDTDVNNGQNMSIERLWMVYKSPIGNWEIGRRSAGAWGLSFVDTANAGDRIFWSSAKLFGENFSTYAFFQKFVEDDAFDATRDDVDSDYYEVGATLKDGWGKASLAYGYGVNNTNDLADEAPYAVSTFPLIDIDDDSFTIINAGTVSMTKAFFGSQSTNHRIKGLGQFKIGSNMGFDTEFDYKFGEKDYNLATKLDQDISSLAFIADFYASVDALTGHAMYFHTSGDDNAEADGDLDGYGGTGADFEPLYILTGVFGNILNTDQGKTNPSAAAAQAAGVHAIVLTADYAATQDLTLHAAFGYAQADKELATYLDNEYGFEYNVGAAYKLQDNLIYAVHLGYLDTGDFFQGANAATELNNIVLASHHLTMSF